MTTPLRRALLAATILTLTGANPASAQIDPARLSTHIRVLSSDAFEGRRPGTPGGEKAVAYIVEAFRQAGLQPGVNGGWLQPVTVDSNRIAGPVAASWSVDGTRTILSATADLAVEARLPVDRVAVADAPLVFVGYGVSRPALGWDDLKGHDLTGKVAVVLGGGPPSGPIAGDVDRFDTARVKRAELVRRGAAGVLFLEDPADGDWARIAGRASERLNAPVQAPGAAPIAPPLTATLRETTARTMLAAAGLDFDALRKRADTRDFKPVALGALRLSVAFDIEHRTVTSPNVIGVKRGRKHPDEAIVFHAHWDHLGRRGDGPYLDRFDTPASAPGRPDDDIFNGAMDNAAGVAGIIEIARAFAATPTDRTVIFMATTEEETQHWGAEYYLQNPVVPLAKTVADLNIDVVSLRGPTRDISVFGLGKTTLEQTLQKIASGHGLVLRAGTEDGPTAGLYRRSEHFNFAQHGVPVLYINSGRTPLVNSPELQARMPYAASYMTQRYHRVTDEWSPQMDLTGAAQHVGLLFEVGLDLATSRAWPEWYPGVEFKAVRDASAHEREEQPRTGAAPPEVFSDRSSRRPGRPGRRLPR